MRKTGLFLLVLILAAGTFVGIRAVLADISSDPPEFYFTRLAYTENPTGCCRHNGGGYRFGGFGGGRATMPVPKAGFICPEFGGGNFFPQQGYGWGIDYPGGDCKFMGGIHRLTGMRVSPNPNVVAVKDPNLFRFPFVYAVEPGGMYFDETDAKIMREYLLRGGFFYADDFWGLAEKANFEEQMRKVFPERQMEVLPRSHEVFHTFFDIGDLIQVPGEGRGCSPGSPTWEVADDREHRIYGMSDDNGRLMVITTYNSDMGDAWEYMDEKCYPEVYSGQAYRVGMNIMIYAMTH